MNRYLMRIEGYFSGWDEFEIDAEDKKDAVIKAKEYCKRHSKYGIGGNYKLDSIKYLPTKNNGGSPIGEPPFLYLLKYWKYNT